MALLISCSQQSMETQPPYPPSPVIKNITWDFQNMKRLAKGSDLWPVTWGADGNLYLGWGDGTGFGNGGNGYLPGEDFVPGSDRASLGFSRIEGAPYNLREYPDPNPNVFNVWGGQFTENSPSFIGKPTGILSVNGILYAWVNVNDKRPIGMTLAWSFNFGKTWSLNNWQFGKEPIDTTRDISFLNYGKNYQGAKDGGEKYVYSYALERGSHFRSQKNQFKFGISLLRVPINHKSMINRDQYEFFGGINHSGDPIWTSDIGKRKIVFDDPNGVLIPACSYIPGIDRYILTIGHNSTDGHSIRRLGVFDAPKPWGPWTTVDYNENWGEFSGYKLGYYIPTKTPDWLSEDGKMFHLIFSGQGKFDSFNLIKANITLIPQARN